MKKGGYLILKGLTWLMQLFPLRVHYCTSDLIYLVTYYILRYRRAVVENNLANSFPDKTTRERDLIARKFYKHLCDTLVETLYFDRISIEAGKKAVFYTNADDINKYLDQGRQVIVIAGHYNNWEWFSNWSLYSKHRFYPIYKKLKSDIFEHFYFNLRSRLGAMPLERGDAVRQLISDHQKGIPSMSAFIFDQTPRIYEIQHWVTFLNQDTPVILGAEKIAQKIDAVVFFSDSRKVKRGAYELEYVLVTEHAAKCEKFEITEKCMQMLEKQIIANPEFWLWSHKKWKHKRTAI